MWNLNKKKELILRELEIYRQERLLEINESFESFRNEKNAEIVFLQKQCAIDTAAYEHKYHSTQEKLGIDIAKLEAIKENLTNNIELTDRMLKVELDAKDAIIEQKDNEINRLNEFIKLLISNQHPQPTTQINKI